MTGWILPCLAVTAMLLLAWCLADARRRGAGPVLELLAATLFGLLVRQAAIAPGAAPGRPDGYRYGPPGWTAAGDMPLSVGAGWGPVLYAAMKYSDGLGVPVWVRPFVDGLYVLMIDLTMEVVAVRLGLRPWAVPPEGQWFGVPYASLGGWLLAGTGFSAAARLLRGPAGRWPAGGPGRLRHALGLGAAALAGAGLTLPLCGTLFRGTGADLWPLGLCTLLWAGVVRHGLRWRRRATGAQVAAARAGAGPAPPWPDPARAMPVAWPAACLLAALGTGAFAGQTLLLFLTGLVAAVGVFLTAAAGEPG